MQELDVTFGLCSNMVTVVWLRQFCYNVVYGKMLMKLPFNSHNANKTYIRVCRDLGLRGGPLSFLRYTVHVYAIHLMLPKSFLCG